MTIKDWMLDHISKNPMISHGSLWRDFCFSKAKGSDKDFYSSISELKESKKIVTIRKELNSFYDLEKQYKRDKLINKLLL